MSRAPFRILRVLGEGIAIAMIAILPSCTHDFAQFDPEGTGATDDGGVDASSTAHDGGSAKDANVGVIDGSDRDASPAVDANAPDASCTPDPTCIGAATDCTTNCTQTETTCMAGCQNQGCRNQCKTTLTTCKAKCNTTCLSCTSAHGCASPSACASATQ